MSGDAWRAACAENNHAKELRRSAGELERLTEMIASLQAIVEKQRSDDDALRAALKECADELEAQIEALYPQADRDTYPTYQRRYDRDIEPVRMARKLLDGER